MKNEKKAIVAAGLVIDVISALLVFFGNPVNMGFCIACFLRDTAGALGFHSAPVVQYIRPEIIGLVLGACIMATVSGEFKARGGSAPVTRFILAVFVIDRLPDVPGLSFPYDPETGRRRRKCYLWFCGICPWYFCRCIFPEKRIYFEALL